MLSILTFKGIYPYYNNGNNNINDLIKGGVTSYFIIITTLSKISLIYRLNILKKIEFNNF